MKLLNECRDHHQSIGGGLPEPGDLKRHTSYKSQKACIATKAGRMDPQMFSTSIGGGERRKGRDPVVTSNVQTHQQANRIELHTMGEIKLTWHDIVLKHKFIEKNI